MRTTLQLVGAVAAGSVLLGLGFWLRGQVEGWHGPAQLGEVTSRAIVLSCVRHRSDELAAQAPRLHFAIRIVSRRNDRTGIVTGTDGTVAGTFVLYLIEEPSLAAARAADVQAERAVDGRMAILLRGNWLALRTADTFASIKLSSCIE